MGTVAFSLRVKREDGKTRAAFSFSFLLFAPRYTQGVLSTDQVDYNRRFSGDEMFTGGGQGVDAGVELGVVVEGRKKNNNNSNNDDNKTSSSTTKL